MNTRQRDYIRHPCRIPIRLQPASASGKARKSAHGQSVNMSCGGVCCLAERPFDKGDCLTLEIDATDPPFRTVARVIWCRQMSAGQYELGVSFFTDQDAYAARMVEQICHIEDYRRSVREREGRELGFDQAAAEWISGFAKDFPSVGGH